VLTSATRFALNDAYHGQIRLRDAGDTNRIRRLHPDEVRFGPTPQTVAPGPG
jgi:hypothetical protein